MSETGSLELISQDDLKVDDIGITDFNEDLNESTLILGSTPEKSNESNKQLDIVAPKTVVNHSGGDSIYYEKNDNDDDDIEDEFEDETLIERLWGLTEMFPEPVRNVTWSLSTTSVSCVKGLYQFSRSAFWIIATSSIILAVPTLIENEKSQLEEFNRQQQRQILLGPSASGASSLTPSLTPQPLGKMN